jgi:site-specific recombinase XerD
MYAVSLFLDYLVDIKEIHSKVTLPRHKRDRNNSRQIVAVEEIKLMFQCALNQRDKVVLALAYGCGLRRTEIHNLNIGDVFLSQSLLVVRAGKNNKRREIPLANYVIDHLRAYLFHERNEYLLRTTQSGSALVLNNQGQRMHGAQLNQRIHVIVERVGSPELTSKHITLHSLRHSIATHMLDAGASFEFVQDFLGHSGIDTVQIYAKRRAHRAMYNKQFTHEFQ